MAASIRFVHVSKHYSAGALSASVYRRNLGLVMQDQRLLADRTVVDNVLLPLAVAGAAPRDAVVNRPALVLADEPTASRDADPQVAVFLPPEATVRDRQVLRTAGAVTLAVAAMLGLAVVAVTFDTIRLQVATRANELEVAALALPAGRVPWLWVLALTATIVVAALGWAGAWLSVWEHVGPGRTGARRGPGNGPVRLAPHLSRLLQSGTFGRISTLISRVLT